MVHNMVEQRLMLEAELIQVRSAIQKLNRKERKLRYKINKCCPISKLHPEILLRIFMAAFPQNSFSSWGFATPLLLGAICHGWRELAWSYPLLWSSVSLTVKHYTTTKNDLLQEWLARSRNLPLSIRFRMHSLIADIQKERSIAWKSMDIIARCSERWQHVDLRLLVMFHPELCFVPTQFPLLVSVSLHEVLTESLTEFRDDLSDFQAVWDAPNLRNAHFEDETRIVLPLKQITTLLYCGKSACRKSLGMLEGAPNLVQCKFGHIADERERDVCDPITALQLEKLEMDCMDYDLAKFFNNLTIPAARELSISTHDYNPSRKCPFPHTAFISLISRSGCHLKHLSLSNITLPADDLTKCFSAVPSLTELSLDKVATMDETLRGLTVYQNSQDILLPNLERLVCIYHRSFFPFEESAPNLGALAVMAKSRWGHSPRILASFEITQLKSIHVEIRYPYRSLYNDGERIKELEEIGLGDETLGRIRCIDRNWNHRCYKPLFTANERHVAARFKRLIVKGMDIQIRSVALIRD